MKTHLPVALRKALLAALVTVSVFAYSRVHASDVISDMTDTSMPVDSLKVQSDTNAKLEHSNITSSGAVEIGSPDDSANETDVLKITEDSEISSQSTITINQNVQVSDSLMKSKGDMTINGALTGHDAKLETTDGGNLFIDKLPASGAYDVTEGFRATVGGNLTVNSTEGKLQLVDATIKTGGDFVVGNESGADDSDLLHFKGTDTTLVEVGRDLKVYQSLIVGPGLDSGECGIGGGYTSVGKASVQVTGSVTVKGDIFAVWEGVVSNSDTTPVLTLFSAGGDIMVTAPVSIEVAGESKLSSENGNVVLNALNEQGPTDGFVNISGNVQAAGHVEITSGENEIQGRRDKRASVSAGNYVKIGIPADAHRSTRYNVLAYADVTSRNADVSVTGGELASVGASKISAKTGVLVSSDEVVVASSTIESSDGDVEITAIDGNATVLDSTVSNTPGTGTSTPVDVQIGSNNETSLVSSTVSGGTVKVEGNVTSVSGGSVKALASVEVQGTTSGTLSDTEVAGTSVSLKGGDFKVVDGTSVTATGENISGNVKSLTVGTAGKTVTEDTLSAGKDVDLIVSDAFTLHGAAHVKTERGSVSVDGGDSSLNTVTGTNTLVESGLDIEFSGACNLVTAGAKLQSASDITLTSDSTVVDHGNLVDSALLTATAGDIALTASRTNRVANGAEVTALDGAVTLQGNVTNIVYGADTAVKAGGGALTLGNQNTQANLVTSAGLTAAGNDGEINLTAHSNVISAQAELQASAGIKVTSTGTTPTVGNQIAASVLQASGGDVELTATNINMVTGSSVDADAGEVSLSGTSNIITANSTIAAGNGIAVTASGQGDTAGNQLAGSTLRAEGGDVDIQAQKHNHVTNGSSIIAEAGSVSFSGATNTLDKAAQVEASGDVSLTGDNVISSESAQGDRTSITAMQGSITLSGSNNIKYATIESRGTEGEVSISTGAGKSTYIEDSALMGERVGISGDTRENLAVVTGEDMLIVSTGYTPGTGITLNNVSVQEIGKDAYNLRAAQDGNIVIQNRVDLFHGTLAIESGPSGAIGSGRIQVEGSNVLNMKAASSLDGRLSGDGSINKSGGDELLLNHHHDSFSGIIYVNGAEGGSEGSVVDTDNAGSWILVTDAGVGEDAKMVLKNTDLVVATDETQIGTLDTTQDAAANNTGTGGTLGADGSYTADDNSRADFKTIGSVLEVNHGTVGDVVHAADMALSDATLLKLDAAVDSEGNASSDHIVATGMVDAAARTGLNSTSAATAPSTARVYIRHADMAAAADAPEGARTTIMSGTMATPVNEDVLYDVEKSSNGTYQRTLQERNVHLENKGDRVELVFSKNYRSAAKNEQMQKVADAIRQYSDDFHHSEGTLAAGRSQLEKLVDAFDYTRSEGAAQRGLQSLLGGGTVVPQLMLFDSSRHHLNQLRRQMEMPVCLRTWKGAPNRKSNAWLTYTGAHDSLNGDANLGDYTRSAHGAMLGVDTSLTCKLRAGLSLGYETSSGEADSNTVDADTIFVDAYAAAITGHIRHRASIGLALTSFDARRSVEVEAGYHSFHGSARSDTDALTLNFGYEISSDYRLNARSWLTRYVTLNLAWHNLDDLKESGLGEVGLVSEYDSEWQAGVAIGVAYNREFAAVKYEAPAVFQAHAAVHFELLADKASANNRFAGVDSGWKMESMEREPLYFELGVGVMVPLSPAWSATAGAALEVGAERTSFSGNVGVRYSF